MPDDWTSTYSTTPQAQVVRELVKARFSVRLVWPRSARYVPDQVRHRRGTAAGPCTGPAASRKGIDLRRPAVEQAKSARGVHPAVGLHDKDRGGHPVLPDPPALSLEGRMHPRTPVGPLRLRVDPPNLHQEPSILDGAETLGLGHPDRVARGGHREEATHQPHQDATRMRLHGLAPHANGLAKYRRPTCYKTPLLRPTGQVPCEAGQRLVVRLAPSLAGEGGDCWLPAP